MNHHGWIGVDLDGTLAHHESTASIDRIGAPIPAMVARVKRWLAAGIEVRIVTARVAATGRFVGSSSRHDTAEFARHQREMIQDWCQEHVGARLPVTANKDFAMRALWDDCAVGVVTNTGEPGACNLDRDTRARLGCPAATTSTDILPRLKSVGFQRGTCEVGV